VTTLRLPRYDRAGLGALVPTCVTSLLEDPEPGGLTLPPAVRGIVVLVLDGLGQRLLTRHAELAPTLSSLPGTVLDAPFPTTTATSLTSLGTGRPPGQHGVVGYSLVPAGTDRRLVTLTWSWDRQDLDLDARDEVVPEQLQPHDTAFDEARRRGVDVTTVLRPEFTTSGLTRAGLRGGRSVEAAGLEATLEAAVTAASVPRPTLVYAHHGDLDTTGHLLGPSTAAWCDELVRVDEALTELRQRLPDDVAVVVTADHGMVTIPPDGFVELADEPALLDGVRVLVGDGRARQLHTIPGAADDVLDAWRDHVDGRAAVVHRDRAFAEGWFGPQPDDRVVPSVGDVVVAATAPGVSWVHRDIDPFGGRLPGMHGGLTDDEVEVPALVLSS
jgi:hypothetical protein